MSNYINTHLNNQIDSLAVQLSSCVFTHYQFNQLFTKLLNHLDRIIAGAIKRCYYLDKDEIYSIATLEIFYCLEDYDFTRSFGGYCNLRISRRLYTLADHYMQLKRNPGHKPLSINQNRATNQRGEPIGLTETLSAPEITRNSQDAKDILNFLKKEDFTRLEWNYYIGARLGLKAAIIAKKSHCTIKQIDNASQRFKEKSRDILSRRVKDANILT